MATQPYHALNDSQNAYNRAWGRNNPEKRIGYRRAIKESSINMYTNGEATCRWCGQGDMDVLCIDHINNDGTKHRHGIGCSAGTHLYQWLRNNDYPEGFQVLCYNCNMKKEVERRRAKVRAKR